MDSRYRIPNSIIHETLDDEAVIINLDNGRYYSMNESGSRIWNAIEAGYSAGEILEAFTRGTGTEDIRGLIADFVAQIVREELVEPAPADRPTERRSELQSDDVAGTALGKPTIEIFTDMERLIPLDPIHEVNERGWPNRRTDAE